MRYAMTGATGFVGGALARLLRDEGHEVRALVRDPARASDLAAHGVELVPGDLDDATALDALCRDVDGLFHVAGWYKLGQRDPSVGDRVNVDGTRRHTGPFTSHYDLTKARAHEIAEQLGSEGLPVVIVQPGLVYGPGDTA